MANRNTIFNNIVFHLVDVLKMEDNEAKISAKQALVENHWIGSDDKSRQAQLPLCDGELLEPCDSSSEFRSITGICNNLDNPSWGAANTLLSREIDVEENDENRNGKHLTILYFFKSVFQDMLLFDCII